MKPRTWSIERELVRWIAGSSLVMAALFGAAAVAFVAQELHHELDLLGTEEIEELEANLRGRSFSRGELDSILRVIADDHPDHRFTWRLWEPGAPAPWATFGPKPDVPLPTSAAEAAAMPLMPERGLRWHFVDVPLTVPEAPALRALRVGLLLDAGPRREAASRAVALVIGIVAVTALVAVAGGVWLARRVGRTLREATARAREVDALGAGAPLAPVGAPTEVLALADAFRGSLAAVREQYSRNLLLTAGMAHELRSPLQNMLGEVSVALLREREPREYRIVLESQLEELRDLGRVVDNLITLTALREPGALARKERFQLGDETELRLAKESVHAAKHGLTLDIERDGDLEVEGDREALLLAIRNLVDNALRYAREEVAVRLHGDDSAVTVDVDDDGPGVPENARELIFEEFRQAPAEARRRGGYGLGLALAKAAAVAHGGGIRVDVSPLGGARFTLTLPRA